MCVVGKKYEKKVELNLIIVYREFNEMSWAGVCLIPHEYHSPTTSGFVIVEKKL